MIGISVLVTAVSGNIGNNIVRILLEADCLVYACDINRYVPCMEEVKGFVQCPAAKEEEYVDFILDYCLRKRIRYVIPVNEQEINKIDRERECFEKNGISLVIQSHRVLAVCLDKLNTMTFLSKNNILTPKVYHRDDILKENKKYIVKKRRSNGARDVWIMYGKEIETIPEDEAESFVQDYIEGTEYTLGVFRCDEDIRVICLERELIMGYSNLVMPVLDERMEKLACDIAKALKLSGYINIQLRRDGLGNDHVFEINPRISGTVYFRHKYGFDDVYWWIEMLEGKTLTDYVPKNMDRIGIRELRERFVEK